MQQRIPHLEESTSTSPALSPGLVQDQDTLLRISIEFHDIRCLKAAQTSITMESGSSRV